MRPPLVPDSLLPPELRAAALWIEGAAPPLREGEHPSPGAVEKRRREVAFGRAAARAALHALGLPDCAVPIRPDRSPAFPRGVVGSISHSRTLALAAVGRSDRWRALGVDIEHDPPLDPDLTTIVATTAEQRRGEAELGLLFSAKEAAFKCWYTGGGGRLADFQEFELSVSPDGTFAIARQPEPRIPLSGRWARADGHWWTACWSPSIA